MSPESVINWAKHKKIACIASGLNKHCSFIPNEVFENCRQHTNAIEQTHYKTGSFGKQLSLLKAVKVYVYLIYS